MTEYRASPSRIGEQDQIDRMERIYADEVADKLLLWEWGRWARQSGTHLGYPAGLLPFSAKGTWEPDLRKYVAKITDEQGELVDAAVSRLPEMHKAVVVAIYKACIESRRLPRVMQISERQINAYRNQAIGMLWAALQEKLNVR